MKALALLLLLVLAAPAVALAAGPPFPPPTDGQSVYDPAGAIELTTERALEERIDTMEVETGAKTVVYLQLDPGVSEEQHLENARSLMNEWGVGRAGFDDGLVILIGLEPDLVHGRVSLFGGSGFTEVYLDEDEMASVIADDFVPLARTGDLDGALIATLAAVDAAVSPGARERLETARQINAVLGVVVAPVVLIGLLGAAYLTWRREGRDPAFLDSRSILMAGPPAGMTPPLATVITTGRATRHSLDTALVELASTGRIGFRNLDQVSEARSDSEADPLTDPAILVLEPPPDTRPLAEPQAFVDTTIRELAGTSGELRRQPLWQLNDAVELFPKLLEADALRLGWFTERPSAAISRLSIVGGLELLAGLVAGTLGVALPASGALLVGIALGLGGMGTIGFGRAMSQRTPLGARVDGMLKAYRRTLQKTLEQSRSMSEVVADDTVRMLADTPDKAVVWGVALGLHDEVAALLERSLADQRSAEGSTQAAYYPYWLSSSASSPVSTLTDGGGQTISRGGGGVFSGSPVPNFGGMFAALGSLGSTPPSSSSSSSGGGGFSGGSSSGGGGSSGSF